MMSKEKIIQNIDSIVNNIKQFTTKNGISIPDFRFIITLERVRFELLSGDKELSDLTIAATVQLCVFQSVELYRDVYPELDKQLAEFLFLLEGVSQKLKHHDVSALGAGREQWLKFYASLEDEL